MSSVLRKTIETIPETADRLMTVRQVATYLNVNERTVLKLVAEGALPAVKIGNQWRFRKAMLETWLDDQMLGVGPAHFAVPELAHTPERRLDLASCFQPDHVIPALAAQTKTGVVEELATLANRLGLVRNRAWFAAALMARENVLPSATGHGVAFMHTLQRNPEHVVRPFMVLGRSRAGVDFDALDGNPTHLFFVLGLKYQELHLPWLARLWQLCERADAIEALMAAPTAEVVFEALSNAERTLESGSHERTLKN